MPGYWRVPEQTARAFRGDPVTGRPRLHTGDYGRLDGDGYLYFEGRRDDMFKRKGIRMSTVEIEAAALDVPGVRAAAAFLLPAAPIWRSWWRVSPASNRTWSYGSWLPVWSPRRCRRCAGWSPSFR